MSEQATKKTAGELIVGYFRDFSILRETRKEYWGIQIVNLVDCTFYFAMLNIASLFLSTELGMSDTHAGFVLAAFTSLTTIMLTVSGMMSDWLGIRFSMRLSMGAMCLLRLAVVVVTLTPAIPRRGLVVALLLVIMAPFMAAIQTIFQAATQRYTTKKSRSAGFNLWYLFMNIGAFLGGIATDLVRRTFELSNVHIFTMGVACAVLCLVVSELMVRNEVQLRGENEKDETPAARPTSENPLRILLNVSRESAFFRLVVLIALILGVRAVYAYLYLLMPKYWVRVIGPDAPIGGLNTINPLGIVIGLILFIPLANKFKVYNMLVYGAMVSAFALFPMALPWQPYAAPAAAIHEASTGFFSMVGGFVGSEWIANLRFWWMMNGSTIANAHVLMGFVCMIIVTIGEVLWSPKLNEYTAEIAPKGQEGTYLGLSMIPWFLAKTLVSALSGPMLTRWSPEKVQVDGQAMPLQQAMIAERIGYWDSPAAMWLVLGAFAFAGCVGALLLRGWLTRHPDKPWIPIDDQVSEKDALKVFAIPAIFGALCAPLWSFVWQHAGSLIAATTRMEFAQRALVFCVLPLSCAFVFTGIWGLVRWSGGRRSGVQMIVLGMIAAILWGAGAGFGWIVWQIVVGA